MKEKEQQEKGRYGEMPEKKRNMNREKTEKREKKKRMVGEGRGKRGLSEKRNMSKRFIMDEEEEEKCMKQEEEWNE